MKICNECGKEYMDYLETCPVCYSSNFRNKEIKAPLKIKKTTTTVKKVKTKEDKGTFGGGFAAVLILGIIPLLFICSFGKEDTRFGATAGGVVTVIVRIIFIIVAFLLK